MKRYILLFLFTVATYSLSAQENSKNSIKVGLGLGFSNNDFNHGIGYIYSFGYQREIWKDRLRINPNLSVGHYNMKFLTAESGDQFRSISYALNFNVDVLKYKSTSLLFACGGLVNNSRGNSDYHYYDDHGTYIPLNEPIYFNDYYYGVSLAAGFRVNSKDKRTAINFLPIFYEASSVSLFEFHPSIQLDFKF